MEKNNKLIAEFMGYKLMSCNRGKAWDIGKSIPSKDHLFPIQGVLHTGNELKFHTSWDWLMPVVIKCFEVGEQTNDDLNFKLNDALLETNIDSLYKVVVEFINQLNNNNHES